MNTLRIICIIMLSLTPFYGISQPAVSSKSAEDLPKHLSYRLAIGARLSETANDIRDQFKANPLHLSESNNNSVLQNFKQAYAESDLKRDFISALAKKMDAGHAKSISRWLNAPTTRTVTHATQVYYTLQGKRKRVIAMYKMDQQKVSRQKKEQIDSLIKSTSAAESSVESSVIILKSILQASNQVSSQRNLSDDQLQAIIGNFKTQLLVQAPKEINHALLIKFYSVDGQALQKYTGFYRTDTGQWLSEAINKSMQAAYQSAASRFLKAL